MIYSLINLMGSSVSSDAAATGSAGSGISSIVMLVAMLLIFYFLLIRPQKKRDKEAKAMMASLRKGDKVVTIGGIHGIIATVRENTVVLRVEDDSKIEFTKSAISSVISKGESAPEEKKEEVVEAPKAEKKTTKKATAKKAKAEEAK